MKQHANFLAERPFSSKVIVRTHTHTHSGLIVRPGPLKVVANYVRLNDHSHSRDTTEKTELTCSILSRRRERSLNQNGMLYCWIKYSRTELILTFRTTWRNVRRVVESRTKRNKLNVTLSFEVCSRSQELLTPTPVHVNQHTTPCAMTERLQCPKQVAQPSQRDRATHELLRFAKLRSGIFEPQFGGLRER